MGQSLQRTRRAVLTPVKPGRRRNTALFPGRPDCPLIWIKASAKNSSYVVR
jgi:hypothetical protein